MKNAKFNKQTNKELIKNYKDKNKNQILKTKQISLLSYSRNSPNESKTQKSTLFNEKNNKKNNSNDIDSLNSPLLYKRNDGKVFNLLESASSGPNILKFLFCSFN